MFNWFKSKLSAPKINSPRMGALRKDNKSNRPQGPDLGEEEEARLALRVSLLCTPLGGWLGSSFGWGALGAG